MKKTVVAGSLVLDILPIFEHKVSTDMLLAEGKVTECRGMQIYVGGEVGNTGLALHRLGIPVHLVSKVGNDSTGFLIQELMKNQNAPCCIMTEKGLPSTASVALAVPGRDKSTIHSRGASQTFAADDIREEILEDADWFHFGYPTSMRSLYEREGEEFVRLLMKVKSHGLGISVDMSLPDLNTDAGGINWRPILKKALPYVDIFMPSIEEACFLFMYRDYRNMVKTYTGRDMTEVIGEELVVSIADEALAMGAGAVLLKCGKRGMLLKTSRMKGCDPKWSGRELWFPPYRAERIYSTTGAGDTAIAGFLSALKMGEKPEEALSMAAFTALTCMKSYDTVSGIGTYQEMKERRKEVSEQMEGPGGTGWHFCPETGCFTGINDRGKAE